MTTADHQPYRLPVRIQSVDVDRSGRWLAAGWQDFLATPTVSLIYGGAFVAISIAVTYGLWSIGLTSLVLPLAGGFVILSPILVVGLYDVSRRLERGQSVSIANCFSAFKDSAGQLSAMGVVLLICWFVWVEVALFLFILFFNQAPPPLDRFVEDVLFSLNGAPLIIVGSLVGAVFASVVFSVTAVSIPLIFDRPIDIATAIGVSILAVRANWRAMFGWAALIGLVNACAISLFFFGLAVALPVLAYATWHCYRDLLADEDENATPSGQLEDDEPVGIGA